LLLFTMRIAVLPLSPAQEASPRARYPKATN
jgi:hypothetical protein